MPERNLIEPEARLEIPDEDADVIRDQDTLTGLIHFAKRGIERRDIWRARGEPSQATARQHGATKPCARQFQKIATCFFRSLL